MASKIPVSDTVKECDMKISGSGSAGTLESGDALVVVESSEAEIELDLAGPSISRYGKEIEASIRTTLAALDIDAARVGLKEKGALDCTIKARLIAACGRATTSGRAETGAGAETGATPAAGKSIPWESLP
jgi:citrate lyase subunit gamma (acyl carrier protein)